MTTINYTDKDDKECKFVYQGNPATNIDRDAIYSEHSACVKQCPLVSADGKVKFCTQYTLDNVGRKVYNDG